MHLARRQETVSDADTDRNAARRGAASDTDAHTNSSFDFFSIGIAVSVTKRHSEPDGWS